jgi:beta-N-acetylhexosaminidase
VNRLTKRGRLALALLAVAALAALGLGIALSADGFEPRQRDAAEELPVSKLAGERIVVGFPGTRVPDPVKRMIRRGRIAGVILFSENLPSRSAGRRLIARLQHVPRPEGVRDPLLVMIDQEGGLVKRIGGAPRASAEVMGARGARFSRRQGRLTARNLRNLGVSVNLAPVLDVARAGSDTAATDRGFGSTARRVRATAIPFARAMQKWGVAATGKHFPGLGAARRDTDFAVQRIRLSKRRLRRVDELPYRRFAAGRGAMVMLSTAIYPAFSPKPAAFARPLATRELRVRLGFRGVSITDALGTVSVGAFGGPAKAGLAAAKAGADLLLYTDFGAGARAYRALRRKLRAGDLDRGRFERSVQRVLVLRHRAGRDPD